MFFIPTLEKNFYEDKEERYHMACNLKWFGFKWSKVDIIYRPFDQPNVADKVKEELKNENDCYLAFSYDAGWSWSFAKLPPDEVELHYKLEIGEKRWQLLQMPEQGDWILIKANTRFVAVKSDIAAVSEDGISWNTYTLPISDIWTKLTYIGGVVMAESEQNKIYSYDGRGWDIAKRN